MAIRIDIDHPAAALAGATVYSDAPNVALAATPEELFIAMTEEQRARQQKMLMLGAVVGGVALLVWLGAFKSVVRAIRR